KSLKAEPEITVVVNNRERYGVTGRLAMQRPQNFKLSLVRPMTKLEEADIGSNDQGCWFWVKGAKDRQVYVCSYDETGESPLDGAMQPDWIVEALGLREIRNDEVAAIQVDRS